MKSYFQCSIQVAETVPGHIRVCGDLTFETARRSRQLGVYIIENSKENIDVDCTDVRESDSAGLAVLLDWLSLARKHGRVLTFVNMPESMRALARISDVESLLEPALAAA